MRPLLFRTSPLFVGNRHERWPRSPQSSRDIRLGQAFPGSRAPSNIHLVEMVVRPRTNPATAASATLTRAAAPDACSVSDSFEWARFICSRT